MIKQKQTNNMSFSTESQNKAELGLDHHEYDSPDEEEYEKYATFHRECRDNPKLMPYIGIVEEGDKSVYELRHELSAFLKWRDANQHLATSLEGKAIWNLVLQRIEVIKGYLY